MNARFTLAFQHLGFLYRIFDWFAYRDDVISINELVLSMKRLQKVPDDTRLQKIAEVLDEDKDGQISLSHVLRVSYIVYDMYSG